MELHIFFWDKSGFQSNQLNLKYNRNSQHDGGAAISGCRQNFLDKATRAVVVVAGIVKASPTK